MINMTCKCGKTCVTFQKMSRSDFPAIWEQDCCKEVKPEQKQAVEISFETDLEPIKIEVAPKKRKGKASKK